MRQRWAVCWYVGFVLLGLVVFPVPSQAQVLGFRKISSQLDFPGELNNTDFFGYSMDALGDLDGDGIPDLAVGSLFDDDGGEDKGAVWILFLDAQGGIKSYQKISDTSGGMEGGLSVDDLFGGAIANMGDLDGDGVIDLAVSIGQDNNKEGSVMILFMNRDGTVRQKQKIAAGEGGFTGPLHAFNFFGNALARIGDLDLDGVNDLAVGAFTDSYDGHDYGALWILFLNADGTVKAQQKISASEGGFSGSLHEGAIFGSAVTALGDLDFDNIPELLVGSSGYVLEEQPFTPRAGAVWLLFMNRDGTVKRSVPISRGLGGFEGILNHGNSFGTTASTIGDIDGDGFLDVAVGAFGDDDGGSDTGAVWLITFGAIGLFVDEVKISASEGGFGGALSDFDYFGMSVAPLGDIDGDGLLDIVVGAPGDDDGGSDRGAIWILNTEYVARNVPVAVDDLPGADALSLGVYPNPASDKVTIAYEGAVPGMVRLAVYNVMGAQVAQLKEGMAQAGRHEVHWDTRSVPAGGYIIRLWTPQQSVSRYVAVVR